MGDFTPQIAQTASVALLFVLLTAIFQYVRLGLKRDRECAWEVSELKADCQWKDQQLADLIHDCQQAGRVVPPIAWQSRPPSRPSKAKRRGERTP